MLAAEQGASFRRDLVIGAGVVLAAVLAAVLVSRGEGHLAQAWLPIAQALGWFAAAALLFFALQRWRRALAPVASVALVAGVMAADLHANNGPNESTALPPKLYDVLEPATKNETIALLKHLTAQPVGSARRDRVELLGMGFEWPNASMVHGFDHTLGYNPLRLEDFSEAVGTRDGVATPSERKFTPLFPSYRCRMANLLGLRYIASPVPIEQVDHSLGGGDLKLIARTREGYVYENPHALARVQFVGGWQFADFDSMKLSGRWPDGADPQQVVLLDSEPPLAAHEGPAAAKAEVKLTRYGNAHVEIEVDTPTAGFVVLNDVWHPWWRAEIDGVATEILKANVLFRAVQVPAGKHIVRFSFRPLEGAIAELRERIDPQEPVDTAPPAPLHEHEGPSVAEAAPLRGPALAGPSASVRESLGLGGGVVATLRNGTAAAAHMPGEPLAQ
jgi:hypothetical protein